VHSLTLVGTILKECFYEKVIKVKADVGALLNNLFSDVPDFICAFVAARNCQRSLLSRTTSLLTSPLVSRTRA
jgi:hypothetical protein